VAACLPVLQGPSHQQAQPAKKFFTERLILCQTSISFAQSNPEWTPVKKLNAGSFYCG